MEEIQKIVDFETKKKWKTIKGHQFRLICNSLIKLMEQAKEHYDKNQFQYAYIKYMCIINIYYDYLQKIKDFNPNISEYRILQNELKDSVDTIEELKSTLKEKTNIPSITKNTSNTQISSPPLKNKKTINSERLFKYIERIVYGNEPNPPQILLIDIRERKDYENSHINWKYKPNSRYSGVINIPIGDFYGMNMNLNELITKAVKNEKDDRRKKLIENICQSDLIVYYDKNSKEYRGDVYNLISNVLFQNSNGNKIKKPPVMLECGYDGWVQFIQDNKKNISEWIEGNGINNNIDNITRRIGNMNLSVGNQNINEVNKNKINNYSNEALTHTYYTQSQFQQYGANDVMSMPQPVNNFYSQPPYSQSSMPVSNSTSYQPITPTNDFYSNINIAASAPSLNSSLNVIYPTTDDSTLQMPTVKPAIPEKPYTLKYQLPSSYQNSTASYQPYGMQPVQPSQPTSSYNLQSSNSSINSDRIPPAIPERNKSLDKLSSSTSFESLNTNISKPIPQKRSSSNNGGKPPIPNKPTQEYSNEIHNTKNGSVGLKNLGNTCYMNSILQCLNATSPLTRYFLSGKYRNDINVKNDLGTHGKLAEEYSRFLYTIWNDHQPVVSPANIKSEISKFNEEFVGSDQHDSQEFLSCILDGLHEDLNLARKDKSKNDIDKVRKNHSYQEKEEEGGNFSIDDLKNRAWKRYIDFNYSIIVTSFQGQYMSVLKCTECGKLSPTFNSLMYLSVPIPDNAKTLYDCLDKYIEIEYLNGDNKWNCPKCKRKVNAQKQILLSKLPDIMLIQLKRFYFDGPFRDKITKNIDFPLRNLNLEKYTYKFNTPESSYSYDLYAISNHYGTLSGGHYTAFVKNKSKNSWIKYDDSRCYSNINESEVKSEAAYILFYVKTDKLKTYKFN